MAEPKVVTGAIALVKVRGKVIGKMKSVSFTENFGRVEVRGLGTIYAQEVPIVTHSGSGSFERFLIDMKSTEITGSIRRDVQDKNEFEDFLVLQEEGIQLDIFKKETDLIDSRGIPKAKLSPLAIIKQVFLDSEGISITEGQVASRSNSFRFIDPVIFPE
jgi:hypothetical protein